MGKEKSDLEQLLNSLVEAWWKPRWLLNEIEYIHAFNDVNQWWRVEISYGDHWYYKALRQIVSKESWLWQFVCENGMVKKEHKHERILDPTFWEWWADCKRQEHDWNYWYRVIESALCDEDKLEEFLLSNIKVDDK